MDYRNEKDLRDDIYEIKNRIAIVKNKLKYIKDNNYIEKLREELSVLDYRSQILQQKHRGIYCSHPLWYVKWKKYKLIEKKTYIGCICVACELYSEGPKERFGQNIINYPKNNNEHKYTFEEVQQIYNELYDKLHSNDKNNNTSINKVLIKKLQIK